MFRRAGRYGAGGLGSLAQVLVGGNWHVRLRCLPRGQGIFGPVDPPHPLCFERRAEKTLLDPIRNGEKKALLHANRAGCGLGPASMKLAPCARGLLHLSTHHSVSSPAPVGRLRPTDAVTDPAKGAHGGISCFMVRYENAGADARDPIQTMMGEEPLAYTSTT